MITLLNGDTYGQEEITTLAVQDEFYYGELMRNAVGSSELRNIYDDPDKQLQYMRGKGGNTEALTLGKLVHWCWLEPDVFYSKQYIDAPRINSPEFVAAINEHGEENVFKMKHKNITEWICRKLDTNEKIHEIRKGAETEVPMVKMLNGVPVRGKADLIKDGIIYDLKTGIVSPQQFEWKIGDINYDLQAWIYMQLFPEMEGFKFIYINKHTRAVGLIEVPKEVIERGREKYELAVRAYFEIFHNRELDEIEYMLDQYLYEGTAK